MSSVQVAVRARPLSQREVDAGTAFCIEIREKSVVLYKSGGRKSERGASSRGSAKEFGFDHSYWSVNKSDDHYADQERVFKDLGVPVLESAFQGYNVCVFAYGQTGSGKTHTMMGNEDALGLIPRICEGLFSWMSREKLESGEQVSYKNEVSYMEIYNEKVRDLLQPSSSAHNQQLHSLRVREHPKEGPYVEELSKHSVSDYSEISRLITAGNTHRVTASTLMNNTSSRSHAIFTIRFTQAKYQFGLPSETVSKIHLVDLAGSERASATGAAGERLKEGGNINRSLVCLGTVISALADMSGGSGNRNKKVFIPYRDSVLTWLLKDSLGGNSKTIMVATISPAESSYGETLSTLRYASRAKNIVNEPTVNEDQNVKLIRELRGEIQRLKTVIQTSGKMDPLPVEGNPRSRSSSISLVEDIHKKEEQVAELTRKWAGKWTDIRRIVEEHHLALRSEGVKMVVDSMQPHFVAVDPDILSTGLVFYYLKDGSTTIGARSDDCSPDICVAGTDIDTEHCSVEVKGHEVMLHPLRGECFLNHTLTKEPVQLSQGDLLQLGESSVLRFNHPHEAQKLRKRHHESLSSPCLSEKAHTLPRRKKKKAPQQSSSNYLIDNVGSVSPAMTSSCTMRVELETTSTVAARRKRRVRSGLTVTPTQSHANEVEAVFPEAPFSPTPSELSHSSDPFSSTTDSQLAYSSDLDSALIMRPHPYHHHNHSDQLVYGSPHRPISRGSVGLWSSLAVWLMAPALICMAAIFTLPVGVLLGIMLFFMRLCGMTRQSLLVRLFSMPLAFLASLTLSPLAMVSELLFQRTLNFLTFIQPQEMNSSLRNRKRERLSY